MKTASLSWLVTPKLAESKWLTASVQSAMEGHLRSARQMEGQEIIDTEILKWAERAYGAKALEDPELLPRLRKAFNTTLPSRFDHWVQPLAIGNSYSHIPPATMIPHSNATVTPYIASFSGDNGEGRLILVDPLNYLFLTPVCCALLIVACYDLVQQHFDKLLDFIIVTTAYYSSDRWQTEALLNNKVWNTESDQLMQVDQELGPVAEKMAFNILGFAFYHEVSHSVLNHLEGNHVAKIKLPGHDLSMNVFTARQMQEIEADAQGYDYFQAMITLSRGTDIDWTGNRYDHAPLVFFRIVELIEKVKTKLTGVDFASSSHPDPMQRFDLLKNQIQSASPEGIDVYNLISGAINRVEAAIATMDLKHHLRNAHLLAGIGPVGL